jgi:uncharacterized protein YqhQ
MARKKINKKIKKKIKKPITKKVIKFGKKAIKKKVVVRKAAKRRKIKNKRKIARKKTAIRVKKKVKKMASKNKVKAKRKIAKKKTAKRKTVTRRVVKRKVKAKRKTKVKRKVAKKVAKRKLKVKRKTFRTAKRTKVKKIIPLGGMAFANGVMLRTKKNMAIAMADDSGRTEVISFRLKNIRDKFRLLFIPFIRGIFFLIENIYFFLKISWNKRPFVKKTLRQKLKHERFINQVGQYIVYFIYLLLLIGFFDYLYIRLNSMTQTTGISVFYDFLLTFLYICIFIVLFFLIAIGRREELNVFSYHGAEHKIIDAYEKTGKTEMKTIKKASLINNRCSIAVFFWATVVLSLLVTFLKISGIDWLVGFLVTIGLVFISFSLAYEFVKLIYFTGSNILLSIFIKPLYIIQAILIQNPDEKHIRVGLFAFNEVMRLEKSK